MNFEIPEHVQTMIEKANAFMKSDVFPIEPMMLEQGFKSLLPTIEEKREKVKAMGLWAPQHPKEVGGMGLSLTEFALLSEVLGQSPLGYFVFGCHAPNACSDGSFPVLNGLALIQNPFPLSLTNC